MEAQAGNEPVTMSEVLGLASWNRARSSEELQHFIHRRSSALETYDDISLE